MADTGTVKFFNADKGFGFIKPDKGGSDIFVHITAVQASGLTGLTENQKVTYDTEPDRRGKGPKAVNLKVPADPFCRFGTLRRPGFCRRAAFCLCGWHSRTACHKHAVFHSASIHRGGNSVSSK